MSRRSIFILAGVAAILVLAGCMMASSFDSTSICRHCGASQSASKWFIPGTEVCYFHPSSVHPTPVSKVLESTGMVKAHEHDWWLSQGGGNGILCAIGHGRHLRGAVESENVAAIISAAHRFEDIAFRDKVVKALLDPKTSLLVFQLGNRVEADSFTTAKNFRAWVAEKSEFFSEELAMVQAE